MSPCSLAESYFSHNESLGRIFIESEGRLSIRKSSWSAGIIPSVFAFPMALMCGPEVAVFHSSIEISRQRAPNQLFGCRPGHVTWNCSPLSILQRLKFESRTSCCGRVCVCVCDRLRDTHTVQVCLISTSVFQTLFVPLVATENLGTIELTVLDGAVISRFLKWTKPRQKSYFL